MTWIQSNCPILVVQSCSHIHTHAAWHYFGPSSICIILCVFFLIRGEVNQENEWLKTCVMLLELQSKHIFHQSNSKYSNIYGFNTEVKNTTFGIRTDWNELNWFYKKYIFLLNRRDDREKPGRERESKAIGRRKKSTKFFLFNDFRHWTDNFTICKNRNWN